MRSSASRKLCPFAGFWNRSFFSSHKTKLAADEIKVVSNKESLPKRIEASARANQKTVSEWIRGIVASALEA